MFPVIPRFSSLLSRMLCGTVSKALVKSKKMKPNFADENLRFTVRVAPCVITMCFGQCPGTKVNGAGFLTGCVP